MKRRWIYLAAGMSGLLVLCAGESKAGEFGGFQVDIGAGENTAVPDDWNTEAEDTGDQSEKPEIQENPWQENTDGALDGWITDTWEDEQTPIRQENPWDNEVQQNVSEESGTENGESFWSGEDYQERENIQPEERLPENTEGMSGGEEIGVSEDTVGTVFEEEQDQELLPAVTVAPTISSQSGSEQRKQEAIHEEKGLSGSTVENKSKDVEEVFAEDIIPELIFWKGEIPSGQPVSLNIAAEGEVRVLSFRINGRENGWKWKGDSLMALENETYAVNENVVAELILLYYDTSGHGIFIDGNRKQ